MAKLPYSGLPLAKLLAPLDGQRSSAKPHGGTKDQRRRVQVTPADVRSMIFHGIELQKKGSLGLAADVYRSVLEAQPNNPDALHLLGTIAMGLGEVDAALEYFKRAVARKPTDPSIRVNIAGALLEKSEPASAEFHLRKALKLHPDLPGALCSLASCRAMLGDSEEATKIYQSILDQTPDHPQALIGYADLCQITGDMETARTLYRRAISSNATPTTALAGLASCEKLAKDSPEAAQIMRYLGTPGLAPTVYLNLNYAAASIAEAAGDHDDAFAHYLRAKALSAARFDIEAHRQKLRTFKGLFTREFLETRAKHGHPSSRPVFIVGMPRSGTTLTEQIISRHPKAAGGGELIDIPDLAASLRRDEDAKSYVKHVSRLSPLEVRELAGRYLGTLDRISADADRVTDKMPQNFLHLGLITLLFPKARIIHCRRNPLDTCLSCFTMHLKDHNHGYAGDLGTLGSYYREYASLMDHWREVLPRSIYELDYERLVESPEEESRKLIEFVGLAWDPACLSPQESARPVHTLSRAQVRQPIYRSSVERWRRYEKHIGPLKAALGDLVTDTGGTASSPG